MPGERHGFTQLQVEIKKSYKADLDNRRASAFLLGLVVVLSLFLCALEFTTRNGAADVDDGVLDDISQDIEMTPVVHREDVVPVVSGGAKPADGGKINVVEKRLQEMPELKPSDGSDVLEGLLGIGSKGFADFPTAMLSPVSVAEQDKPVDFQVVERLPEFPGGMSEFVQWLTKNLRYPAAAQRNKQQGTVLVAFIINKDGTTTGHKVVRSAALELDREALRVIKTMPKWKPGEDHGQPCRTYFCIPIVFKL